MRSEHGPQEGFVNTVVVAIILFIVAVLLVAAGTGYAVLQARQQSQAKETELRALCAEQLDVANAAPQPNSSKLGVRIIVDFRTAYVGLGCPGKLPPPSAELLKLAAKYHVRVLR